MYFTKDIIYCNFKTKKNFRVHWLFALAICLSGVYRKVRYSKVRYSKVRYSKVRYSKVYNIKYGTLPELTGFFFDFIKLFVVYKLPIFECSVVQPRLV